MSITDYFEKAEVIGAKAWHELFNKIHVASVMEVEKRSLTMKKAKRVNNMERNRYMDVLPYDQFRITLENCEEGRDYINASPIYIERARRKYILAQGPLSNTCNDFWQMVWEQDVPAIIMLNRLFEGSRSKCEGYYPTKEKPDLDFSTFKVHLLGEESRHSFMIRKLRLINKGRKRDGEREIVHIQYTEWPDFGIPASTVCFLNMLDYIKDVNVLSECDDSPPCVIHCSAGIGRSGTFIVVDGVLRMVELGVPQSEIVLNDLIIELRCQRFGLIQTPQQLKFCWNAIVDGLKRHNKKTEVASIRTEKTGENTDEMNGRTKNKRKQEDEESSEDRMAKRRELVSRMVAKSRELEAKRSNYHGGIGTRALLTGGAIAAAAFIGYYLYCKVMKTTSLEEVRSGIRFP